MHEGAPEARPPLLAASLAVGLVCVLLGFIGALELRHVSGVHGLPLTWSAILMSTMPRWIFLGAALPFVMYISLRYPVRPLRGSTILLHVLLFAAVSVSHAAIDTWSQVFSTPQVAIVFGLIPRLTRSWYNTVPSVVTAYAAVLFAAWGMLEAREREWRTVRSAQLESQLQTAKLAALRAQLQPHFLYNTLNGIAALVSDVQPARAVSAIEQLGELLHASLRDDGREEITVAEEVALAERYLALQTMRFGNRLQYTVDVAPRVSNALVPVLLLQPIVENAVVHGLDAGQELLNVHISAVSAGDDVAIVVENDGSDIVRATGKAGHGVGLATTRARLITMHGDRASLSLAPRDGGGAIVRVEMPRRIAAAPRAPAAELQGMP